MRTRPFLVLSMLLLGLFLLGCSSSTPEAKQEQALKEAIEEASPALQEELEDQLLTPEPENTLKWGKEKFYGVWENTNDFNDQTSHLFMLYGEYGTFANDLGEFRFTFELVDDDALRLRHTGSGSTRTDPNIKLFIDDDGLDDKTFAWIDENTFELDGKRWVKIEE